MNSQFLDFKVILKQDKEEILVTCQGQNNKGVFLFYHQDDEHQLPFLRKILQAVQLDYDKDILSLSGDTSLTFSISDILTDRATSKVIVFGFPPTQIGLHLNLPKYQAHKVGPCTYLFADALSAIEQQSNLKKLLWEGLQVLFK